MVVTPEQICPLTDAQRFVLECAVINKNVPRMHPKTRRWLAQRLLIDVTVNQGLIKTLKITKLGEDTLIFDRAMKRLMKMEKTDE